MYKALVQPGLGATVLYVNAAQGEGLWGARGQGGPRMLRDGMRLGSFRGSFVSFTVLLKAGSGCRNENLVLRFYKTSPHSL